MASLVLEFLKVFIPMFVVIDPFGTMVLFISLTSTMSEKYRKAATRDAVIYGSLILILFAVVGNLVLYFFGISISALEIAGGIILLMMGIEMVREGDRPKSSGSTEDQADVGIVPFATPLLAGPGAISLVIILMKGGFLDEIFTLASIVILFVIVYIFFTFSRRIMKITGERVMKALTRIFGLLVAAFAVQYLISALTILGMVK